MPTELLADLPKPATLASDLQSAHVLTGTRLPGAQNPDAQVSTLDQPGPRYLPRPRPLYLQTGAIPMLLVHLSVFAVIWTGWTWQDALICFALYVVRMFAVTAGYHRYFSHRSFKTSRVGQFVLAFLAQSSAQKGVLWWAAHHRDHHRLSDTANDVHSPLQHGFWYSHVGWLFDHTDATDVSRVRDLAKFAELRWLNRFHLVPAVLLGAACWLYGGWSCLVVGFCLSTVILWHATFAINSLAHLIGRRRFPTDDGSRNSLALALMTLGEGWHNNHHYYMQSARQGFYWWQIDITYYVLVLLSRLRLVSDLRQPPAAVLRAGRVKT